MKNLTKKRDILYENAKARYNYHVLNIYNAGMVLTGPQIKDITDGKVNISAAFATVNQGRIMLNNVLLDGQAVNNIPLLLNKKEILHITKELQLEQRTLIPLALRVQQRAKLALGLCKGKKVYDKKKAIREREILKFSLQT